MASLEVHFVDAASGLCVQTLQVTRADMTAAQVTAELAANKPASRTLAYPSQGHVCAPRPADPGQPKIDRLAALRAKGWAQLTDAEKAEASALKFDLGL